MKRFLRLACMTLVLLASATFPAAAQPAAQPAPRAATALMLDVVIARYQGDKRVSSLPYSLAVNANDNEQSRLRIGGQVPVASTSMVADSKTPLTSYGYRDIGTSIDARASTLDDSRFRVLISIDDTSVYADLDTPGLKATGHPSFRSFRSNNTLVLRDGQSAEFTTATDRISGEVTRVTVKLSIMK